MASFWFGNSCCVIWWLHQYAPAKAIHDLVLEKAIHDLALFTNQFTRDWQSYQKLRNVEPTQ
jgi:hypothetical protein